MRKLWPMRRQRCRLRCPCELRGLDGAAGERGAGSAGAGAGMSQRDLAPGEWAVLALLCEHPAHGWALASTLSPGGEVGSVWALGRPLVYRSLEILERRGLIEPAGHEPSERGPSRTIFRATAAGCSAVERWLAEPVERVREIRSLLLLKLVFAERSGTNQLELLDEQ